MLRRGPLGTCASFLVFSLLAGVAAAQQSAADLTGAWAGSSGAKVAVLVSAPQIRVCTTRSTAGSFIKVYSGAAPSAGAMTTLISTPRTINDIGADIPADVRQQLVSGGYSFRIDVLSLPNDRMQINWYVDNVTYGSTSHKVSAVTPATIPAPETFSRVNYGTPGWTRRGIEGIVYHFGRVLRNDGRWRDWYQN